MTGEWGGSFGLELGAFGLFPRRPVENGDEHGFRAGLRRYTQMDEEARAGRERWIGEEIRSSLRHIGLVW